MITRRYVLAIHDTVDRKQFLQELEQNSESVRTYPTLTEYFAVSWYPQQYEYFKDDQRISIIERDRAAVIAADERKVIDRWNSNWGLARIDQINQPVFKQNKGTLWRTRLGENVDIYVMDTGIRASHRSLTPRVSTLFDSFAGPTDPNYGADENGHGTHVAGIAASEDYGVAPRALVYNVKCFNRNGSGLTSDILAGIDAILNHHQTKTSGNPSVANFSWTYRSTNTLVENAIITKLYQEGVVVVTAAGNFADDASKYTPARVSEILTVGSINIGDEISAFSNISTIGQFVESGQIIVDGSPQDPIPQTNTGAAVDIFAPGDGIISTWNNSDTSRNILNGTSMAAPFASGVAAFRLQGQPKPTTAAEVDAVNQFIIDVSTKNKIQDLPAGTNDRILYSFYVPSTLTWLDPEDNYTVIGEFDEQSNVSVTVKAESRTVYNELQNINYSIVSGTLPSGLNLNSATGEITGTAPVVTGDTDFTFTVRAEGGENSEDRTVTITVLNVNLPPEWITPAGSIGTFTENDNVNVALEAQDPEGEPVSYALLNGNLSDYGLVLDSTGFILGTLPDLDTNNVIGPIEFTVRASDPKGPPTGISDRTFSFTIAGNNPPPVWITTDTFLQPGGSNPTVGTFFFFTLEGQDPEAETVTYELIDGDGLVGLPGQIFPLTLDTASGNISGFTPNTPNVYTITVGLNDGVNPLVTRSFNIQILSVAGNLPPVWVTPPGSLGSFNEGETVSIILEALDPEDEGLIFTEGTPPAVSGLTKAGLPPGLSISNDGVITGTVQDDIVTAGLISQTWLFSIDVTDTPVGGTPATETQAFSISIGNVNENVGPQWITPSGSLGSIIENDRSIFAVEAFDPEGKQITYTRRAGSLPKGLQLDTNTGLITGRPQSVTSDQTFTFTVEASDGFNKILRSFSITVLDYWQSDIWNIEIDLTGYDRIATTYEFYSHFSEIDLFRPSDRNWGFKHHTAIYLVDGINLFPPTFSFSGLFTDIQTTFDLDTTVFDLSVDETTFDTQEASTSADVLINELSQHHMPTKVLLGPLNWAVARDSNGDPLYEVIYRDIIDPLAQADFLVPYPQANSAVQNLGIGDGTTTDFKLIKTGETRRTIAVYEDEKQIPFEKLIVSGDDLTITEPPADGAQILVFYLTDNSPTSTEAANVEYLTPASINNMRRDLIDKYGFADPELLPRWQRSEQVAGDPTSIIGFKPAIPLAYVQPGTAEKAIQSVQEDPVRGCVMTIDRYHVSNEVDDLENRIRFDLIENQTTWNADTTTYDNDTTIFDVSSETTFDGDTTRFDVDEIGRVDKYIKFPPGDIIGVS